jgi:hypothetical protein
LIVSNLKYLHNNTDNKGDIYARKSIGIKALTISNVLPSRNLLKELRVKHW